jgi:hypothetical protein
MPSDNLTGYLGPLPSQHGPDANGGGGVLRTVYPHLIRDRGGPSLCLFTTFEWEARLMWAIRPQFQPFLELHDRIGDLAQLTTMAQWQAAFTYCSIVRRPRKYSTTFKSNF